MCSKQEELFISHGIFRLHKYYVAGNGEINLFIFAA
jgi:hypothetical protein